MTDLLIDGVAPSAGELGYLALVNYGAYTSFRVEQGGARGLSLHLARLEASSLELFGEAHPGMRLRELMRTALGDRTEAWLRVSLFAPEIWARTPDWVGLPRVMTSVSRPPAALASELRLQTQSQGRLLAHVKHTATLEAIRARRLARQAGFDDALFTTADGRIAEGSLWNVGFLKGDTVVWPEGPMLDGVTQALIDQGLGTVGMASIRRPVRIEDLPDFDGAFSCNSATPACPITRIDAVAYAIDQDRIGRLRRAWAAAPPEAI